MKVIHGGEDGYKMYKDGSQAWDAYNEQKPSEFTPFYIENIGTGTGTISIKKANNNAPTIAVSYSTDGETWTSLGSTSTTALTIDIAVGSRVYFKGDNSWGSTTSYYNSISSSYTGNYTSRPAFKIGGNILSLAGWDVSSPIDYYTAYGSDYYFVYLFRQFYNLVDASDLLLLMKRMTNTGAYYGLFHSCYDLIKAPELPAVYLGPRSYYQMFYGCYNLKVGPSILPTLSLPEYAYYQMFYNCYNLERCPGIVATNVGNYACYNMFSFCKSLVEYPVVLPATYVGNNGYGYMFQHCPIKVAPKLPASYVGTSGYTYMFSGCTSLEKVPFIGWIDSGNITNGMTYMFTGCTSLKDVTIASIPPAAFVNNWMLGVPGGGVMHIMSRVDPSIADPIIPKGWTLDTPGWDELLHFTNPGDTTHTLNVIISRNQGSTPFAYSFEPWNNNWTSISVMIGTVSIDVPAGSTVWFKGELSGTSIGTPQGRLDVKFGGTDTFNVGGNPRSLHEGEGPWATTNSGCYYQLFKGFTGLLDASKLALENGSSMPIYAFNEMFDGCTSLIKAPYLNQYSSQSDGMYQYMFRGCTSLVDAALMVTNYMGVSAGSLFYGMYEGCTSLKNAQCLPPINGGYRICYGMFKGCTSLENAPIIPESQGGSASGGDNLRSMFEGCTSLKSVVFNCPSGINYAGEGSYIFKNCSQLRTVYIRMAPNNDPLTFGDWLSGVAAKGTLYIFDWDGTSISSLPVPSGWKTVDLLRS